MNYSSSVIGTLVFFGSLAIIASAFGAETKVVYSLQRIPPGTIVVDPEAERWNELILLARPMVTSGDIERLPSGVAQSVSRFSYTIMATISKLPRESAGDPPAKGSSAADANETANSQEASYRLTEVGIGYSARVQGRDVLVSASQEVANANLGIIDRQVLAQNEKDLDTARVIVRSSTLMMFELVAILARENGNREEPIRTMVWINEKTGKSAMAMWVAEQRSDDGGLGESTTRPDDPMQVHSGGKRGDNRLHVDAGTFFLGIPTSKTFGLEHLLRGRQIQWTDTLRELANKSSYSRETMAKFTAELSKAIRATQNGSAVEQ